MPRVVDHDQRRQELAQAVWALIRRRGLAGVTIRSLSQESGWSSGAIRHYLPNRESILNFAAEQINVQAEQELRALVAGPDPRQNLLELLTHLMPVDEDSRLTMEVWLAFVGAAVSEQHFADTQGIMYRNLSELFRKILGDYAARGWLSGRDSVEAATELHALLDGLSVHLLLRVITPEQARATLEAALGRLLTVPVGR